MSNFVFNFNSKDYNVSIEKNNYHFNINTMGKQYNLYNKESVNKVAKVILENFNLSSISKDEKSIVKMQLINQLSEAVETTAASTGLKSLGHDLLYLQAKEQTHQAEQRLLNIDHLQQNTYYLRECASTGKNPLHGYIQELSYYMTASENTYLQLTQSYIEQGNYAEAAECYAKAIQLTGFIGELPEIPKLKSYLESSYKEMIRRLPDDIKNAIQKEVSTLPNIDNCIRLLFRALNKQEFQILFGKEMNFPFKKADYIALEGVRRGWITKNQFATLMKIQSLKEDDYTYSQIEVLPLSNRRSRELIEDTMIPLRLIDGIANYDRGAKPFLNQHQLDSMFKKMEDALPSEQCIILVEDSKNYKLTISQFISFSVGFNVLSRPLRYDQRRIVPSVSLEKAFLTARFNQPCLPNYVLGNSSIKDIRKNGLNFERDVAIPFDKYRVPKEADGRAAPMQIDFIHHDYFHCYSSSEVGQDAIFYINIADYILTLPQYKNMDQQAKIFRFSLIDLDFSDYRHQVKNIIGWIPHNPEVSKEATLWHCISSCALSTKQPSEDVKVLLKEVTLYLLSQNKLSKESLIEAGQYARSCFEKQGINSLPKDYRWCYTHHPLFVMLSTVS